MFKLRKYLKPFIFPIILALCLLFVQAICDLNLPNLMSEIVNVGIQSNGIEEPTPKVISENGKKLITIFMTDEEKVLVENSYIKLQTAKENYRKNYSNVNMDSYVLKEDISAEDLEKLDKAFEISIRTFLNIASNENNKSNTLQENTSENLSKVYEMLPYFENISIETINEKREEAKAVDEDTLKQIAIEFIKIFYKEAGINLNNIQNEYILKTGAKMLAMTLLIIVVATVVNYIATIVSKKLTKNLTKDVFEKVVQFSDKEFDKFLTSSLITRTTNDIVQVQNVVYMAIKIIAYAPIMGIGGITMILQRNSNMTWILGVAFAAVIFLSIAVFALAIPKFKKLQNLIDKINLVSREILNGTMVTRAFRNQKHEEQRFDKVNKELLKTNIFINRVMWALMPAMTLIMNGITVIIVWVGAKQIAESNLMVGDMMAFIQYAMQVIMSFIMFAAMFIMIPRASVSGKRVAEVLETEPSIKQIENPKEFDKNKIGYVEFKNVSFKYPDAEENVIENISFVAEPRKTTAFIGSTGSGKSTLIKLIPRFYDATEGEVFVSGVNVKEAEQFELQNQIGYIPQTANLLTGTIEENLKYGNPNATDAVMEEAAKVAQATEFITQKEEGYKSKIAQSGKNISGGQKQRLSIARALVKQAPIYIFDDSFSALDFKTDSKLRKALKEYNKNSTVLIVAQRVSTIMYAEQIIVLENGKIVGKGTHKELLKNCPTYYEIASSQLKKEELE